MRVLAIAIAVFAAVAQASLADRKQSGRKLYEEETENCGVFREQPCNNGCAPGLIVDAFHWADWSDTISFLLTLGLPVRRLADTTDTTDTIEAADKKSRSRDSDRPPTFPFEEAGPPLCVPCGQLTQLPCPHEDEWLPKCAQGLVASNILGYISYDLLAETYGAGRRLDGSPWNYWSSFFLSGPDAVSDALSFLIDVVVGINICLPCGGEDQPPCDSDDGTVNEVGCIEGLGLDNSGFETVTIGNLPILPPFPILLPTVAKCVSGN